MPAGPNLSVLIVDKPFVIAESEYLHSRLSGIQIMTNNRVNVLCRYHYDPLDRLIGASPLNDFELNNFYCKSRLVTEIQGVVQRSIVQQADQLLAQHEREGNAVATTLLVTDQMRSVLELIGVPPSQLISYSPYGHRDSKNGLLSLLGFNGERPDSITGHYLLGNGYRAFNPVLMRFNSPDNVSPFGKGGINQYAYCLGDPINRYDESGHFSLIKKMTSFLSGLRNRPKASSSPLGVDDVQKYNLYENTIDGVISARAKKYTIKKYNQDLQNGSPAIVVPVMRIQSAEDLLSIPSSEKLRMAARYSGTPYEVNFIFTARKEFFVANLKHADLSIITNSPKVISAGYISPHNGDFYISNSSGHFKPSPESLKPVEDFLTGIGARVNSVRHCW
jgi:RHS repeat-associated protein